MRRGFNAIELGIVLVVLLVLAGLLLSGVQKVREAAARASCTNNLKSHGFAAVNYYSANDHFPLAALPNPVLLPEQRLSFHIALNPYIEASLLYKLIAKAEPWDSPANVAAVADYSAQLYRCPAWIERQKGEPHSLSGHLAVTNYAGVAGVGADAATRPAEALGNGVFGYDRTITLKDVKDGTSSTAMLIETAHDVGPWVRGGPGTVRAVEADAVRFGGTHPRSGGFNVLLADASVRFTKPDIAPEVLAALATVAGGEEIPANW